MAPNKAKTPVPVTAGQLLDRALAGDQNSFWQLVAPHERSLFAVAYGVTRDPEHASDVVHDTFVRAVATLGNLRTPDKLGGWLYSMARNIAHERLRRREREDRTARAAGPTPEVIPVSTLMMQEEEFAALDVAMKALPEQHRVVLGLKYMSDLSCKEIAEYLDIGVEAAKSRLFEARRVLRERLKGSDGERQGVEAR